MSGLMNIAQGGKRWHNHFLIAKTAKEIAGAFYEDAARDDAFYKRYPSQDEFIASQHHQFIQVAREILVKCLASPNLPDVAKDDIYEALLKDKTIPAASRGGQPTGGVHRALITGLKEALAGVKLK